MSTVRPISDTPALRWALVLVLVVLAALIGPAAAHADDSSTFGFNTQCDQAHDALQGLDIPGLPILSDGVSALCKGANVATHPGDAVNAVKDAAWDSTFGKVVDSLLTGLGQAVSLALTFWSSVPNSSVEDLPNLTAKVREYTDDIQVFLLAASWMFVAGRLAWAKMSTAVDEAREGFQVLFRTALSSAVWTSAIVGGTRAADAFSEWVIDDSTNGNAKGIAEAMIQTQALTWFSPGLMIIFAIVGLLSGLMQVVLAIVRQGLLAVVAGVLPLAAAASGSRTGRGFYDRLLLWSVAFVLYKPIAALCYMTAFTVAGTNNKLDSNTQPDSDTAVRALVGIALLCSVAFVLPALMRLLSPVASMGSGISGAVAGGGLMGAIGGAVGMAARMPSGAASSHGSGAVRGSGGGGGGGGSRPPSGAAPGPSGGGGGG
ncbi:hypothetical protein ACWELJ_21410, partial [Nocardia sp. NPDC004582]